MPLGDSRQSAISRAQTVLCFNSATLTGSGIEERCCALEADSVDVFEAMGKETKKRVPCPGQLLHSIVPPTSLMRSLTI